MFLLALYSLYVYKKKIWVMCCGQFLFLMFSSVWVKGNSHTFSREYQRGGNRKFVKYKNSEIT